MTPQLTLQAPLELPPAEVSGYLEKLWGEGMLGSHGGATFSLVVWQPAWVEQQLVRTGLLEGPVTGVVRDGLIDAAREAVGACDLPAGTSPLSPDLAWALGQRPGDRDAADLRGQHVDGAISEHMPRRLITLAPTLDAPHALETLVAAYCPLPEEGAAAAACGDVVVMRGDAGSLSQGLRLLDPLLPSDLPCWVWWNGSVDEAPELLQSLVHGPRRLVMDSAMGSPRRCLDLLGERIGAGQAVNDLNWLRLRGWRESLAMVFDPPSRRDALNHVVQLDIDVEGDHPGQGLLLTAWIADRLGWRMLSSRSLEEGGIETDFERSDGARVRFRLLHVPMGLPHPHPGQIVGVRLICEPEQHPPLCVILCSESGGCMRLEAGGVASMELVEDVVPSRPMRDEAEVARLLSGGHDTTNPLLASAAPLAARLLPRA
ncbi:glucose 6-phosphate dehydrogenase [Synechococcus sp. RSCCF101]|uniref:glucose-6-phosphate dehydrogenase assembly protein OpcA n=1 Tax=Synechococcus sp. RSCCF101 TaxID=2511069 RepID=UPI0012470D49|nr:glucose-6-phosphate dehydrogenase assembly protein OpcA [Synechococcus sp. RSCCF101]QEY31040.1 glucose 6-phosphate dehydrogenase [Synechococcus sp. RSCCF101]